MGRQNMRFVQTTDSNVFVSNSRAQEEEVQLFNLPGPVYGTESGRWLPKHNTLITSWYVSSSTVGNIDLWVVLNIGDNGFLYSEEGEGRSLLILEAGSKIASGPMYWGSSVYTYPTLTTDQWCSVVFSDSTGHTDVTVQLYGKRMDV